MVGNGKMIHRISGFKSRIWLLFLPQYFNELRTVVKGNLFRIGNSVNSIKIWKKSMCPPFWKGTWKHTLGFKYPSVKAKKVGRVESQSNNKPFYNRTFIASFLTEKKGFFFRLQTQIKIPFTIFLFQKVFQSTSFPDKLHRKSDLSMFLELFREFLTTIADSCEKMSQIRFENLAN